MIRIVLWTVVIIALLLVVDRVLLWMEWNGWINYRRRGLSRPGAAYHGLLLESIFNPGAENIVEVKYADEQEQDESGDTHRPRRPDLSVDSPTSDDSRASRELAE